jgi:hypothetical protein
MDSSAKESVTHIYIHIQGVSGGIVHILEGCIIDYSE